MDFSEWPWGGVTVCVVSRNLGVGGIMTGSGTTGKFIGNEASNSSIAMNFGCEVIGSSLGSRPVPSNRDTKDF